jgi:hypothetical protein
MPTEDTIAIVDAAILQNTQDTHKYIYEQTKFDYETQEMQNLTHPAAPKSTAPIITPIELNGNGASPSCSCSSSLTSSFLGMRGSEREPRPLLPMIAGATILAADEWKYMAVVVSFVCQGLKRARSWFVPPL